VLRELSPSVTLVHGEAVPVPTFAKDQFALTAEALPARGSRGASCSVEPAVQSHRRHLQPRAA